MSVSQLPLAYTRDKARQPLAVSVQEVAVIRSVKDVKTELTRLEKPITSEDYFSAASPTNTIRGVLDPAPARRRSSKRPTLSQSKMEQRRICRQVSGRAPGLSALQTGKMLRFLLVTLFGNGRRAQRESAADGNANANSIYVPSLPRSNYNNNN